MQKSHGALLADLFEQRGVSRWGQRSALLEKLTMFSMLWGFCRKSTRQMQRKRFSNSLKINGRAFSKMAFKCMHGVNSTCGVVVALLDCVHMEFGWQQNKTQQPSKLK